MDDDEIDLPELSPDLEDALAQIPDIREMLDDDAIAVLARVNIDRAVEVLEDLAAKGDVRNPSAFVAAALTKFPRKRTRPNGDASHSSDLDTLLARNPSIVRQLDDAAIRKLREADVDRAIEILEDIVMKGDVRNPSAFVATALGKFPHKRDGGPRRARELDLDPPVSARRSHRHSRGNLLERALRDYPHIGQSLDADALAQLRDADPERAVEIVQDMAAKGDVRNPSAFAMKALQAHPHKRSAEGSLRTIAAENNGHGGGDYRDVRDILRRFRDVVDTLDETVLARLHDSDPARVLELLQDLSVKTDINNPSAFIAKALNQHPKPRGGDHSIDKVLEQYPQVLLALDDQAILKLRESDPERAVEVIEDVADKDDIKNVSAFIVKALHAFPQARGNASSKLELLLTRHPEIGNALDENAFVALHEADPSRAVEVLEDLLVKGDVRNPSAFVAKSLYQYPKKRGQTAGGDTSHHSSASQRHPSYTRRSYTPPRVSKGSRNPVDRMLKDPAIRGSLDDDVIRQLHAADEGRAVEILEELALKRDVRNPSAFVSKALSSFPLKRGGGGSDGTERGGRDSGGERSGRDSRAWSAGPRSRGTSARDVNGALRRHPALRNALDERALDKLHAADPERAVEIIEDVAAQGDVRNPSAFVVKALNEHPQKRSREDELVYDYDRDRAPPEQKRPRARASSAGAAMATRQRKRDVGGEAGADLAQSLDEQAQRLLAAADEARAQEILEELADLGSSVRNPSAFVARALSQHPHARGRTHGGGGGGGSGGRGLGGGGDGGFGWA